MRPRRRRKSWTFIYLIFDVRQFLSRCKLLFEMTGIITGASAVGTALGSPLIGRWGDKVGQRRLLIASGLAAALFYLPQAFVPNATWLALWQWLIGFAVGGTLSTLTALLIQFSPRARGHDYWVGFKHRRAGQRNWADGRSQRRRVGAASTVHPVSGRTRGRNAGRRPLGARAPTRSERSRCRLTRHHTKSAHAVQPIQRDISFAASLSALAISGTRSSVIRSVGTGMPMAAMTLPS